MLVALVFNVFAMNVFAADSTIKIDVTGATSANESENSGNVNIKITSTVEKDLIVKILDVANNNKVIYMDTVLGTENDTTISVPQGEGEEALVVPAKVTTIIFAKADIGFKKFKVIASESSAAEEKEFEVTKYVPEPTHNNNTGDYTTKDETKSWDGDDKDKDKKPEEENTIKDNKTGEEQKRADEDTIYEPVVKDAAKQTTASGGAKFIDKTTAATSPESLQWESTRNTIAVSVETMMANIGSKKISTSSSTNKLILKETSISDADLKKYHCSC